MVWSRYVVTFSLAVSVRQTVWRLGPLQVMKRYCKVWYKKERFFLFGLLKIQCLTAEINHCKKKYFTSSDPHHDMLGGGCQVRVVIENMMGRMENLRTLISGFLGLVILVRWALVTMFLSWTTQTGCRIHRTYVSLIGSGESRHTTHLLKCVLLLSTSQTDWKQSSDVLSDISFDILSDISSDISSDILSDISVDILSDIYISSDILSGIFLTYLLTFFLTYLPIFFLASFWHIFWHSFWHIFWHSFWHIFWHAFWHIFWHSFWHIKTKT